jgi:hypothetical protein
MGNQNAATITGSVIAVHLVTTGCLTRAQVWLTDGVSAEAVEVPDGILAATLTLYLQALKGGTWQLFGEVLGPHGFAQRSAPVVITVSP